MYNNDYWQLIIEVNHVFMHFMTFIFDTCIMIFAPYIYT